MKLKCRICEAFPEMTEDDFGCYKSDLYVRVAVPGLVGWIRENYMLSDCVISFVAHSRNYENKASDTMKQSGYMGIWLDIPGAA